MPDRTRRPPVRMVHLGLGAFHRAHQAWYTDRAGRRVGDRGVHRPVAGGRGRARGAGRRSTSLVERAAGGDTATLVQSIVDGPRRWRRTGVAGRGRRPRRRGPDADGHRGRVPRDVLGRARRRRSRRHRALTSGGNARTAPGRVVDGLRARRAAGARPARRGELRQPARERVRHRARRPERRLDGGPGPRRLDRAERVLRVDDGGPDHARDDRRRPGRRPTLDRVRRCRACVTEPFSEWVLERRLPGRSPAVGTGRSKVRRRHRAVRAPQALAAQRRALPARLPGPSAGPRHGRRRPADRSRTSSRALWAEARPLLPLDATEIDDALAALRDGSPTRGSATSWRRSRRTVLQAARAGGRAAASSPRRGPAGGVGPARRARRVGRLPRAIRSDRRRVGTARGRAALDPSARAAAVLATLAPDLTASLLDPLATRIADLERL